MITVNLYNIISSNSIFKRLLDCEFSGKQAFLIGRMLKAVSEESAAFEKIRSDMLKKYADKDEKGQFITDQKGMVQISPENKEKFSNEVNELLYTTCELNIEPIPYEWLESIRLTPTEAYLLEPFLKI